MARDGPTAKAYPTPDQYNRWKNRADHLDMSVSEFVQAMVEAGMKVDRGFDVAVQQVETVHELRRDRYELRQEVDRLRERVETLEERLYDRERAVVMEAVDEHEHATYDQLLDHVQSTVPDRLNRHLDALSGDKLQRVDGGWTRQTEEQVQ